MRIVAIYSSDSGAGKSTLAMVIAERLSMNLRVQRLSFADPIKSILSDLETSRSRKLSYTDVCNNFNDHAMKDAPQFGGGAKMVSPRDLMISLGAWGRQYGYWVDIMNTSLANLERDVDVAIIDDLRAPDEYEMLDKRGAFFVRLVRNKPLSCHLFEGGLEGRVFDITIRNTADSAGEYKNQCEKFADRLISLIL